MAVDREGSFGPYIRKKRIALEPHVTLRKMAELVGLSKEHMSNVETGRQAAPKQEVLEKLATHLRLTKRETEVMYDLAAKSKRNKNQMAVPADLPEYITTNEYAKIALRMAKDVDATDEEWMEFVEKLKRRAKGGT